MEKQKKVHGLTISPRENLNAIPTDLLISIFSRLPLKDVARCHCVSKQWAFILRLPDFTELFLKMSWARPSLLFTFRFKGKWLFYSAPQPLNPDQNSSLLVPYYHMSFPNGLGSSDEICPPVRGLLCSKTRKPMIYNPSTADCITLPKATSTKNMVETYFGYDPIDKRFKVLCVSKDYRVLTLGTGEVSWRLIECSIPHIRSRDGVCIDGVLYYLAECIGNGNPKPYMVVRFDVRLEKFEFLAVDNALWGSTLINCKGKLGAVRSDSNGNVVDERTRRLELWVLEDVDEQLWSRQIYVLTPLLKSLLVNMAYTWLYIVGMAGSGEIVLSQFHLSDPFYIYYCNVVRNTVVRVEIQIGNIVALKTRPSKIHTFIDHEENLKLMN